MRGVLRSLFIGSIVLGLGCGQGDGSGTDVAHMCNALVGVDAVSSSQALDSDGTTRFIVHYRAGSDGEAVMKKYAHKGARHFKEKRAASTWLTPREAKTLEADPEVLLVEEDASRRPFAQKVPVGIEAVQAPQVWAQQPSGRRGVKTCIVDSGFHVGHADLPKTGVTGFPADWNQDGCGHGTHVAGTLAALNNDEGVVGVVNQGMDLVIVKIFNAKCEQIASSDLANAVDQCVNAGAKVINLSLGGDVPTEYERAAFESAWRRGAVIVAAAGNDGTTSMQYPASYASVISVAAATSNSTAIADFSQRNVQVDLTAPGVSVLSTSPFEARHFLSVGGKRFDGAGFEYARTTAGITGNLVNGGTCGTAGSWAGKVVLCARGGYSFAQKATAVQKGGGVAAVIYNNEAGLFVGTLGTTTTWTIPVISLSQEDGLAAKAYVGSSAKVVNQELTNGSGYVSMSGTSMASPHVAGVASLVWGEVPTATNTQLRMALESTAQDMGPAGRDDASGYGLVQAQAAVEALRSQPFVNAAPIPAFSSHCVGTTCSFLSTSLDPDGSIRSFRFDLGDGTTSYSNRVMHGFKGPGPYNVTLTVTDNAGVSRHLTQAVSVLSAQVVVANEDGKSKASLTWQGAAETHVLVIKDGELAESTPNSGDFEDDVVDVEATPTYQVCTRSMESCSEVRTFRCP